VNTVGDAGSHWLPSSRRGTPFQQARLVAQCATVHSHSVLVDSLRHLTVCGREAAGGAVPIVATELIGGGTARDEGAGQPAFWHGRVARDDFVGSGMSRQIGVNAGNTATTEYECRHMYEDKPARIPRGGQYQGRVVGAASVSCVSVSSVGQAAVCLAGEPALGVMGGLLQPVSSPAEPPVSSLSGSFANPSTTAPAPFGDVLAGDVSPLAYAAPAAMEVVPSRPAAVSVLPRGRAGSANRNQHT